MLRFWTAILLPLPHILVAAVEPSVGHTGGHSIDILHRAHHPALEDTPWTHRASVFVPSANDRTVFQQSSNVPTELQAVLNVANDLPDTVYQLALFIPGLPNSQDVAVASVKACHLALATSDYLNIHVSTDGTPYGISYYLADIPKDGSCPSKKRMLAAQPDLANTTVSVRRPSLPPLPELRQAPPISPKGEPIKPEPEKTFIQKYWFYIAIGLLALLLGGGAPPEEGNAPAGSGGGNAGRAR